MWYVSVFPERLAMTESQIKRILAEPDKYLDGSLKIKACISYDRNTGMGDQVNLDDDEDPVSVPPFPEVRWEGDGWYEDATLTGINGDGHGGHRCDVDLEGGGEAGGYGPGDVEIVDERFPELLREEVIVAV